MPVFVADQLRALTKEIFFRKGAGEENAGIVARLLVKSNLAGHDSHGIIRIPSYVKFIDEGKVDPKAEGSVEVDKGSISLINGQSGLGQVVATKAMKIAIGKAKDYGTSAVGIYNCGHIGRMADYCMMAAEEDMIGMTMVNGGPGVSPFGGIERVLSTNPFGIAVPASKEIPFVLDIATSVCAAGKIEVRKARGQRLPEGWIIDKAGDPSTDPDDYLVRGGSILTMGGMVGYKGYGLAMMIDILGGALTGNGCTSSKEFKESNGTFMMAIDISSFTSIDIFKKRVDELISSMRNSRKASGVKAIMTPGEPEFLEEERRLKEGVYVEESTWGRISIVATNLDLILPKPIRP